MLRLLLAVLFGCLPVLAQLSSAVPCPIQRAAAKGENVWLLCDRQGVYVSPDEGKTWKARRAPTEAKLRAVAVLDARRGFVAGDGGTLLATSDAGATWEPVAVPVKDNLTSIYFVGDHGWIAGWTGAILHSKDGGKTWERQSSGILHALDDIFFADEKHGWAVGWAGTILRTTDGGATWEQVRVPNVMWSMSAVYFTDLNNGWITGFNGQILRSRDGGRTWEPVSSPVQSWLTSVVFDRSGRGWIAAENGLLTTEDGGSSWKILPVEGTVFLHQVLTSKEALWAVGNWGVLRQRPGERTLTPVTNLPAAAGGSRASGVDATD